ncbi:MAG: dihydroorotase [Bulleidia sp.]|nr:dihydroorotase [Bulleidia sp.]
MKRLIRNAKVLYHGELMEKEVLFDENRILQIDDHIEADAQIIDAGGNAVLPGLVDVHVHFRQPGREGKETIYTGSLAAAHGGFTSVFAMPNVIPSPDDADIMEEYLKLIETESVIHTYPYGTITRSEAGKQLSDLKGMRKLGVRWFSDDGVGMNNQDLMKQALQFSKDNDCIIACHTEDLAYRKPGASVHESPYAHQHGWIGIPDECESAPLIADLKTEMEVNGRYHACHISSHQSVEALKTAKSAGLDVTAEVTVHHLLLENTDVKGPMWKMNPPLRTHDDRMSLIEGLENGTLDFIANDHAPHTYEDKNTTMDKAAFGIVSIETAFPLLYTEFVRNTGRWTLQQLIEWMSEKPAARFGLEKTGRIEEGWKPDMFIADLNTTDRIDPSTFYSKGKNTPFIGWETCAKIKETIVDGKTVWKEETE